MTTAYLTDGKRLVEVLRSGPLISARDLVKGYYLTIDSSEVQDDEHPDVKWRAVIPKD